MDRVNTGIIYIPSEDHYDINSIEYALSNLIKNNINYFPAWIEQSAFAHMFFTNGMYVSLSDSKYRIPFFQKINLKEVECLHFVSYPETRKLYPQYFKYILLKKSSPVYTKDFSINFNNIIIPLTVSIKKLDNQLLIEFHWLLKNTEQSFLDHVFKINDTLFHFQSEEYNFFIIDCKNSVLKIEHSYDWFGQNDWQILDHINI